MIASITLNNITSYNEEVTIEELKKLNFFYGNNGSGKSTIAKYLYHLYASEENQYLNIESCSQIGYEEENTQILVFDESFIQRNFIENENLNGIFSLDEQNEEIDNIIKTEQLKIKANDSFYIELDGEKSAISQSKQTNFTTLKTQIFRKRDIFKDLLKISPKHSGNSSNHLFEIKRVLNEEKEKDISLTYINTTYVELFEKEILDIKTNVKPDLYKELRILESTINQVLDTIIVGNQDIDIAALIEKLNIKKWVEEGINYTDRTGESQTCPFCQEQTVSETLIKKFESYFNETYKTKIKKIEDLKEEYKVSSNKIISNLKEIVEVYNPNQKTTVLIKEIEQFFSDNKAMIQYKIDHSNEKKVITSVLSFKKKLSDLIKSITNHNETFNSLGKKKVELIEDIWSYLAYHSKDEIEKNIEDEYNLALLFFEFDEIKKQVYGASQKSLKIIEENRSLTVDTDTAKDNINDILASSGITGFKIEKIEEDNSIPKYYLKREGLGSNSPETFKTLSEGEKNFISFLYFYQLCIGTDNEANIEKKKVVVIDDPVSSLDSQVLFLVTTLIRDLVKKKGRIGSARNDFFNESIRQVFVLTHNTYFFKEVTFPMGNKLCYDIAYFQVSKINGKTGITRLDKNNIDNDYNLLWRALTELKTNPEDQNNIVIGNIMRRILQTFLNFTRTNSNEWKIIEELPQDDPKRIIFSSLISQINDDSHESNPLDELHFQRMGQANTVDLFDVFELIFKDIGGEEHFNAMSAIVR
jgi:wobble nucleotide-excising tRNase